MPIVAVAVAIGTSVAAGSAVAAAGLTLMTALEVTAAIGASISAIGVVTGNKDLSLAGMALGVVGGVGSLAAGAGLLGSDASTAPLFGTDTAASVSDTTADAAQPIEGVTTETLPGSVNAAGATEGAGGSSDDFIDSLTGATTANPAGAAIGQQIGAASGNANSIVASPDTALGQSLGSGGASTGASATEAPTTAATGSSALPTTPGSVAVAQPGNAALVAPPTPAVPTVAAPAPPGLSPGDLAEWNSANPAGTATMQNAVAGALAPSSPADAASGLSKFLNTPAGAVGLMGAIQAGGSFIAGATSSLTPAQVAAFNAQAAANNAQAGLTNLQVGNLSQPIPVATRGSNAAGLINSPAIGVT